MTNDSDKTTHFGFETVAESDKAGRVQGVFNSVASKYDIMNDVMSVGIHRVWKEAMMDWLRAPAKSCWMSPGGPAMCRSSFWAVPDRATPPCWI